MGEKKGNVLDLVLVQHFELDTVRNTLVRWDWPCQSNIREDAVVVVVVGVADSVSKNSEHTKW